MLQSGEAQFFCETYERFRRTEWCIASSFRFLWKIFGNQFQIISVWRLFNKFFSLFLSLNQYNFQFNQFMASNMIGSIDNYVFKYVYLSIFKKPLLPALYLQNVKLLFNCFDYYSRKKFELIILSKLSFVIIYTIYHSVIGIFFVSWTFKK